MESLPSPLLYDSGNGYVYVVNTSNSVSVIDGTVVVATVSVGFGPGEMTYDSGNGDVYVLNNLGNTVSVISGTSVVATIPVGDSPVAVAYDSGNSLCSSRSSSTR